MIANAPGINSSATAFASAITQVYGTTATRESAAQFVPFTGSAADSAIRNRVTTFRTQFEQYGITAINAGTTGPSSATAALSPAGLQRAITDSAVLGLQAAQLGTITRQGIGDIELSLKLRLFDSFQPSCVIGFGGYPALPALLAARSAKVPTVIHEQNAVLGRVNRFLAKRVDAIATAPVVSGGENSKPVAPVVVQSVEILVK